jgi:opacity protein-like surface antigen
MFKLFSVSNLVALFVFFSLDTINLPLAAQECCCCSEENRLYIGGFGGQIYSNSPKLTQRGTAFFSEDLGGPLAVDAKGHSHKNTSGYGGVQIGYEWKQLAYRCGCSNWSISPAAEVEAYFYSHKKKGTLNNPTYRLDAHNFDVSFPMDVGIYVINGVLAFNNDSWKFTPYIGGGIGAANLHIHKAKSIQIDPDEPGINHFNSGRSDTSWAFVAQAKAGIRYNFCERFHVFAEYRFLFVDSSRYLLGSTVYPTHVPTSTWDIDVKSIYNNAFAVGIQFDL